MSAQRSLGTLGGLIVMFLVEKLKVCRHFGVLMSADVSAGETKERRRKVVFSAAISQAAVSQEKLQTCVFVSGHQC